MDYLFTYFSFLDTLRFRNLRIERSCGDDFQILGIIIVIDFINEFKSSALRSVDIILKCLRFRLVGSLT